MVKNPPANAGDLTDTGLIPGSGRSPGGEHGNPLQYPCLENPMDRGAWWATVHGVTVSDMTEATQHVCMHICLPIIRFSRTGAMFYSFSEPRMLPSK